MGGLAAVVAVVAWRGWRYLTASRTGTGPGVRVDDGVLLHVEAGGPRDAGPTVMLVHGFAASMEQMEHQRSALEDRYRVLQVDLRGHGRSGWRGRRRVGMDRLGRDLAEVLESRTRGRVIVVAHSMGGMAVMALAQSRPELVGSVITGVALLSTSEGHLARTVMPGSVARCMARSGLTEAALLGSWLVAPLIDHLRPFRTRWGRHWLARRLVADPARHPEVPDTMADARSGLPRSDTFAFYPGMVQHDGAPGLDVLRRVPTLVLSGTDDRTIPSEHSRRIAERLGPGARLVLVPGAGHMVNVTHVEIVNDALLELLRRADRDVAPGGT